MGDRDISIKALLDRANRDLNSIEAEYNKSLESQSISDDLRIDIKNFCENLRSALDYLAQDIFDKYCCKKNSRGILYFPILHDRKSFENKMSSWFPGLNQAAPDLWIYLESIQPYNGAQQEWIAHFNKVNKENKHKALIEQTKTITEEIQVDIPKVGYVRWNPSNVRFGQGVYRRCPC